MPNENPTPPNDDAYVPEDDEIISEFDLTPDGDEPSFEDVLETADAPADAEAPTPEEFAAVRERAAKAETDRDEFEAKLLRTAADYQNFVRRSQLNLDAEKQETLMKVAKALVGVLDNFDRALELDPETTSSADMHQGVVSIQASLLQALEGFGLKKITVAAGDEFDPNLHEALMRQPVEGVEPNHIAAQFMPGYVLKDHPVRPAQVSVAE